MLAAAGYREQQARFASGGQETAADPACALAAFAAAYVRSPQDAFRSFWTGPPPEMACGGDAVLAAVLPAARAVAADELAAFDLLLRVAAAAHGLAVFLRQGLFGVSGDILDDGELRGPHGRAVVADLGR